MTIEPVNRQINDDSRKNFYNAYSISFLPLQLNKSISLVTRVIAYI